MTQAPLRTRFVSTFCCVALLLWGVPLHSQPKPSAEAPAEPPAPRRSALRDRIPLGASGKVGVTYDALRGQLSLSPFSDAQATSLATRLPYGCRFAGRAAGQALIRCDERRLEVRLVSGVRGPALDVVRLRGLPLFPADPLRHHPYVDLVGGEPCPPDGPLIPRTECLLQRGDEKSAIPLLESAYGYEDEGVYAALRLGDLAADKGKLAEAADQYRRAGKLGPYGRLARARLCELEGGCLKDTNLAREGSAFHEVALPPRHRGEMVLRAARANLVLGRLPEAAKVLQQNRATDPASGVCQAASKLCREMLLALLEEAPLEALPDVLPLFLGLDVMALSADERVPLVVAAADRGERLGATSFAAAWLGRVTGDLPPGERVAHLTRIVELYLEA
ncbi:MAG: tetratricopeptide repeat protein, partial [Myxococcota bacterium]